MNGLLNELRFTLRNRSLLGGIVLLALLAATSVVMGIGQARAQSAVIDKVRTEDAAERATAIRNATDYGGAAYDSFYATWNPPAPLAFAALGQRDINPYVLRVRALALEGQIYETDNLNPVLLQAGRFDYAFLVAYLLPLFIIFCFFDLTASERESGRYGLLLASAGTVRRLWGQRIAVRLLLLSIAVIVPLWIGAAASGTPATVLAGATLIVLAQTVLWALLSIALALRPLSGDVVATVLTGLWLLTAVLLPMVGKTWIEQTTAGVHGPEIALLQREVVNDAWDLPKEATMTRFFEQHPEWADTAPIEKPFHWKWYYAFQQVGDAAAAELAARYTEERLRRHKLTGRVGWLSPSVAVQLALQRLASTDSPANIAYEAGVRRFHADLRRFYYPLLFRAVPFERKRLADPPLWRPDHYLAR